MIDYVCDMSWTLKEDAPIGFVAIPGWDGGYWVNVVGVVWSAKAGRFLKPRSNDKGYTTVSLYTKEKDRVTSLVHRLVAAAFIGPPPEGKGDINHIDFDPTNNHASNLEYTNRSGNIEHSIAGGRWNHRMRPIVATRLSDGAIFRFRSTREAEKETGVTCSSIFVCIRNRREGRSQRRSRCGWVFAEAPAEQ